MLFVKYYNILNRISEEESCWEREFIKHTLTSSNNRFLDMGCSSGRLLKIALEAGYSHVIGMDNCANSLEMAEYHLSSEFKNRYTLINADFKDYNPDIHPNTIACWTDTFRLVHSRSCRQLALNNWNKMLSTGGKLLLWIENFNHNSRVNIERNLEIATPEGILKVKAKTIDDLTSAKRISTISLTMGDITETSEFVFQLISYDEIRQDLTTSGFIINELYGSLAGQPYSDGSESQIFLAEKRVSG